MNLAETETDSRSSAEPVASTSKRERTNQDHLPSSSKNEVPITWLSASNNETPYQLTQITMAARPSTSNTWQPGDANQGNAGEQPNNDNLQSAGEWRPPRQKYTCPDPFRDPRVKKRSFLSRVMSSSSSDDSDDFSLR